MHVVWKRPDGFHGASPEDFRIVNVGGRGRIWLHRTDFNWYPFRIAGGWQESDATQRLNNLVNLVDQDTLKWERHLANLFRNSMSEEPSAFLDDLIIWIQDLLGHLKGDSWELEILAMTLNDVIAKIKNIKPSQVCSS